MPETVINDRNGNTVKVGDHVYIRITVDEVWPAHGGCFEGFVESDESSSNPRLRWTSRGAFCEKINMDSVLWNYGLPATANLAAEPATENSVEVEQHYCAICESLGRDKTKATFAVEPVPGMDVAEYACDEHLKDAMAQHEAVLVTDLRIGI